MTQKHPKPSMQSKLGTALLKSLINLREKKGEILIEDVGAILENMASSLHTEHTQADSFLRNEIGKMANYIIEAKQEIASLIPTPVDEKHNPAPQDISHASTQLDAVIKATEEATVTILDTADEIQAIVKSMGTGSETEMKLNAAAARIYEACNFQDLTGQRIKKVMATLEYIEAKILKLATLFGEPDKNTKEIIEKQPKSKKRARPDEHLMSGPQMPGNAPSQADIDALFADIKQA